MAKVVLGFERVTGKTFPKLKPNDRFREAPTFYVANHTACSPMARRCGGPRTPK